MDITAEDIKVCDCCGMPTVEGGITQVIDLSEEEVEEGGFWICESCKTELESVVGYSNVDFFINDISRSFDVWSIAQEQFALIIFSNIYKVWKSFGISAAQE